MAPRPIRATSSWPSLTCFMCFPPCGRPSCRTAGCPCRRRYGGVAASGRVCRYLARSEDDGNGAGAARQGVAVEDRGGGGGDGVVRHSREHLLQTDLEFQAGEIGPEAAVDASAE